MLGIIKTFYRIGIQAMNEKLIGSISCALWCPFIPKECDSNQGHKFELHSFGMIGTLLSIT